MHFVDMRLAACLKSFAHDLWLNTIPSWYSSELSFRSLKWAYGAFACFFCTCFCGVKRSICYVPTMNIYKLRLTEWRRISLRRQAQPRLSVFSWQHEEVLSVKLHNPENLMGNMSSANGLLGFRNRILMPNSIWPDIICCTLWNVINA